jgi:predicted dienelactone hydrolase
VTAVAVPAFAAPPFELPSPTGPYPVGTISWVLSDKSRSDPLSPPGSARAVPVVAFYPAALAAGPPAPYLRAGLEEVRSFATLIRQTGVFDDLAGAQTHSTLDAPVADSPSRFPVLVFSHGYLAIPSSYTALLEDLASHGYVVLGIIHPYEASAATLPDGRTVTMLDSNQEMRKTVRAVLDEWEGEDAAMKAVTEAGNEKDQTRLLKSYLGTLRATGETLKAWVADTRLALDSLGAHPSPGPTARLAPRVNLSRVGAFGHSMGGVASGQFCLEDARCAAGLNLDGIPQYGDMIDRRLKRPFLMVYSGRPGRMGASDAIYAKAAAPYYRVDVKDALHLDFSDMPLWPGGGLRERGAYGTLDPRRAIMVTRAIVREYFDQILLNRPSPLLSGDAVLPELTVHPRAGGNRGP